MKTRYRNVAFLVELMVNILVFSISCAVLVGLFGKAGQLSKDTREETAAANQVQTLVEAYKAGGEQALVDALGYSSPEENGEKTYRFTFNDGWAIYYAPETSLVPPYTITLTLREEPSAAGTLTYIEAVATYHNNYPDRQLYHLQTSHYVPNPA